MEGIGLELSISSQLQLNCTREQRQKMSVTCHTVKCSWSHLQINAVKWQETSSNAAGNWHRQWTTTDLIWCHPPWQLSKLKWSNKWHSHPDIRKRERDCLNLKTLIKAHSVIWIWTFLHVVTAWGLSKLHETLRRVYYVLKTCFISHSVFDFLRPLVQGKEGW